MSDLELLSLKQELSKLSGNERKEISAYLESIPESWILPGWEIQIFYFLKNPAASFQIFD
jgi:hypothetical protein